MGSLRLKNKALLKIAGKTIIETIFSRLKACLEVDDVILSTPLSKENDILVKQAGKIGLKSHRGSENDLISRHYGAAKKFKADTVVKITGDCPLVDPSLVDKMVGVYKKSNKKIDFLTNCFPPTFPDGLDIDVIPLTTLERLNKEVKNLLHREFFTVYITENYKKFKIYNFKNTADLSSMRWTLDYPEDLIFIKEIFKGLAGKNKVFTMEDVLGFLKKNPRLLKINKGKIDKTILNNVRSGEYHSMTKQ